MEPAESFWSFRSIRSPIGVHSESPWESRGVTSRTTDGHCGCAAEAQRLQVCQDRHKAAQEVQHEHASMAFLQFLSQTESKSSAAISEMRLGMVGVCLGHDSIEMH